MNNPTQEGSVGRFTPQQLLAMVNAQIAANAMAQSQAQAQYYAETQLQLQNQSAAMNHVATMDHAEASGQSQAMLMAHDMTMNMNNPSKKGKARAKGTKFSNLHAGSKNIGAQINPAGKLKKTTRPLNSFMAFRSYYSKIFQGFQQKNISGFLTMLWKADPFKAKWAILAKGFSEIRDNMGKTDAILPEFLEINAPLMRMVEPDRYLVGLGWELSIDAEAKLMLHREDGFDEASISSDLITTNVSVADVLENSYQHGYITRHGHADIAHSNGQVMIMASSAQPAMPATDGGDSMASIYDNNDHGKMEHELTDSIIGSVSNANLGDHHTGVMDATENASANVFVDMSSTFGSPDTQLLNNAGNTLNGTSTNALDSASNGMDFGLVDAHVGNYPYNLAFDPANGDSTYTFDPFQGNTFDAFNMSNVDEFNMEDWLVSPNGPFSTSDEDFFAL